MRPPSVSLYAKALDADQITSAGFGAVERAIGALEEILRRLDFGLGKIRNSDAYRQPQRITLADVERMCLDLVAQPLGERDGAHFTRLGDGNDEFVATIARNGVDATGRTSQEERDLDQHLIASE